MANLIPPKPQCSASPAVTRMFRLLKKLSDEYTVRHLLDITNGPQFLVLWRNRYAFLLHVAATSQELADTAISPMFLPNADTFRLDETADAKRFGPVASDLPVRRMVVFPNVDNATIDQIERMQTEEHGVTYLGLKQTTPERFAAHLEALATEPLTEPMLLELRTRFDAGSRIHNSSATRLAPLLHRAKTTRLPPMFLDIQQETMAKLDVTLPPETERLATRFETRLVTGPAGCGKSLVLLHRALFAARLNHRSRILILTHNRPLNAELRRRARETAPHGSRIQSLTFFQWAWRYKRRKNARIIYPHESLRLIESLTGPGIGKLTTAFIAEEIGYLRDLGINSLEDYLNLERNGRIMGLTAEPRRKIWKLLEAYREKLRARNESDWHDLALGFRNFSRKYPEKLEKYDFIFIDEAQFFAKVWFDPVLASLSPGGQLFLAADSTQGFLKRNNSWLAAGIDVRGRATRLSKPYRSSRSILRFAREIIRQRSPLHPESTENLDPPSDSDIASIPDEGETPKILPSPSPQDALNLVSREVANLQQRSPHLSGRVLILHADSSATANLTSSLRAKLGHTAVADHDSRDPQPPSPFCSVSRLMSATGLEAAIVFLLGIDTLLEREADPRLDESARAELAADHTRLLYMACTRAAHRLVILSNHLTRPHHPAKDPSPCPPAETAPPEIPTTR